MNPGILEISAILIASLNGITVLVKDLDMLGSCDKACHVLLKLCEKGSECGNISLRPGLVGIEAS